MASSTSSTRATNGSAKSSTKSNNKSSSTSKDKSTTESSSSTGHQSHSSWSPSSSSSAEKNTYSIDRYTTDPTDGNPNYAYSATETSTQAHIDNMKSQLDDFDAKYDAGIAGQGSHQKQYPD